MHDKLDTDFEILVALKQLRTEDLTFKYNPDRVISHTTGTEEFSIGEYFKARDFIRGVWLK